jgi:hypothetical protein
MKRARSPGFKPHFAPRFPTLLYPHFALPFHPHFALIFCCPFPRQFRVCFGGCFVAVPGEVFGSVFRPFFNQFPRAFFRAVSESVFQFILTRSQHPLLPRFSLPVLGYFPPVKPGTNSPPFSPSQIALKSGSKSPLQTTSKMGVPPSHDPPPSPQCKKASCQARFHPSILSSQCKAM